jgi:bifunctional DNase/RNase
MENATCRSPGCDDEPVVHTYPVWNRRITHPAMYCGEHSLVFWANYSHAQLRRDGPPQSIGKSVVFDLELLVIDKRLNMPCSFSLREVGAGRRLDCTIGTFEAAALRRELDGLSFPRPPTHRAMSAIISALGGQLTYVEIDKLYQDNEDVFEAKLHLQQADRAIFVDIRPSDALVLAIVCEVPIAVSNSVLAGLAGHE